MKIKLSNFAKGSIVETENYIGSGFIIIRKEHLSDIDIARLRARGVSKCMDNDDAVDKLVCGDPIFAKKTDVLYHFNTSREDFTARCFLEESGDRVFWINEDYSNTACPSLGRAVSVYGDVAVWGENNALVACVRGESVSVETLRAIINSLTETEE